MGERASFSSLGPVMKKPLTWTVVLTIINGSWAAFTVFSGLATKQFVLDEVTAAVNSHDHGYPEPLKPDPKTQILPPVHHEIVDRVDACTNADSKQEAALNAQRERSASLEIELVKEIAARVRWQAAAAEPDSRKRMSTGQVAYEKFMQLASDWPCVQKTARCIAPDEASRLALETRPPR